MGVGRCVFLGLALPVALASSALSRQPLDLGINLDPPIECWYTDEFPLIGAEIPNRGALDLSLRPPSFRSLRLYYRCEQYADYYYIEFEAKAETAFEAVAPMAEESCTGVYYYVEGITPEYASTRTPERRVDVTTSGACRDRFPAVAWWLGSDAPEIIVRSAAAATPLLPLGFKAQGVATASGGAGIGTGTAIALGAGAGGRRRRPGRHERRGPVDDVEPGNDDSASVRVELFDHHVANSAPDNDECGRGTKGLLHDRSLAPTNSDRAFHPLGWHVFDTPDEQRFLSVGAWGRQNT